MIIVNQSRTEVYNFDNIISIKIETGRHIYIREVTQEVGGRYMGSYNTEERAKEVLQEIIKKYRSTEIYKAVANKITDQVSSTALKYGFVYEMPLK